MLAGRSQVSAHEEGLCGGKGDVTLARPTADELHRNRLAANTIQFHLGFLQKAQELRAAGIDPGVPLEEEYDPLGDGQHSVQATTTGLMYWRNGGPPLFFETA
jgi:hypothetical protein